MSHFNPQTLAQTIQAVSHYHLTTNRKKELSNKQAVIKYYM